MHDSFTDLSLNPITTARGGFNFGVGPGFQVFVARSVALVFEVGYAYSWFKSSDDLVESGASHASIRIRVCILRKAQPCGDRLTRSGVPSGRCYVEKIYTLVANYLDCQQVNSA
jgi:hypothetical protein